MSMLDPWSVRRSKYSQERYSRKQTSTLLLAGSARLQLCVLLWC